MARTLELELTIENGDQRLDRELLRALLQRENSISRAELKEHFKKGEVLVAGRARAAADSLPAGVHSVTIRNWSQEKGAAPDPRGSVIPVLYEDEDLLILNKPAGTPSVPHSAEENSSAVNSALAHFPALIRVGEKPLEPGLLHRLDTGTSGILVFAKSQPEFERIHSAWKTRAVEKYYRAWSVGPIEPPPGNHSLVLGHDAKSSKRMRVLMSDADLRMIRGKPLETLTRVEATHQRERRDGLTLADLEIRIETGVMHQIRCVLSHLKAPILGDTRYRGAPAQRLWLHAWRIVLPLRSGARLEVEAALPPDWKTPS